MAGSSNFKVFNETFTNAQSDADYTAETQRTGGLLNGMAKTAMHNKLFRQLSIMVAAVGQFIANLGGNASDVDLPALTQAFTDAVAAVSADSIEDINTALATHIADTTKHKTGDGLTDVKLKNTDTGVYYYLRLDDDGLYLVEV